MGLPYTPQWTEMDSQVCAFLKTVDPSFDAEEQLENLEMKEDIAEWWLQKTRQEAVSAAAGAVLMVERESADDHATIPHKRITAAFVFGQDAQDTSTNSGVASVDISGLLPSTPPGPEDRPTGTIAPARLDTIEEEPAEIEESAETLARRIEGMTTTEEQISLEKLSQTQKRNAQRRRAKARVNEAARAESLASSSGAKKQDFSKDRKS